MNNHYIQAYYNNEKVREYVDKYCVKHGKEPKEAVEDYLVREYINCCEKDIHDPYVATYNCGC